MRSINYISKFLIIAICLCFATVNGYSQNLLDLEVKDLNGEVSSLRERIDPSSNYIIEAMAFWCGPCRRSMDDFTYHQSYWKERFNTEIIVIDDEHYDDIPYVVDEMEEGQWDLDIFLSDDAFDGLGINVYPTYYFVEAFSDSIYEIPKGDEQFLLEKVDSVFFHPIVNTDFEQSIFREECGTGIGAYFSSQTSTVTVGDFEYYQFEDLLFRERDLNGDILLLDIESGMEQSYIKYSAPLCSKQILIDADGDELEYKVLEKYQVDGDRRVLTDQVLFDDCGASIPFELIQGIGTNAGFRFDIQNGKINSRLICHSDGSGLIYVDDDLSDFCLFVDVKDVPNDIDVNVSPNPASDYLNIILNEEGEKKAEIWTVDGQLLASHSTNDNLIIFNNLNRNKDAQVLICKVKTANGMYVQKIVFSR